MNRIRWAAMLLGMVAASQAAAAAPDNATIHPAAIFPFEERGTNVKGYGPQVADLLFARLAANAGLYLVDRSDLAKALGEQSLGMAGMVKPNEAARVGQLTGAKLLITGSVFQVDKKVYVVAKIMGTETSRVVGTSVSGKAGDELAPLAEKLADQIAQTIGKQAGQLVAPRTAPRDRIAALKKRLGEGKRPTVLVEIQERHVGRPTIDPAAETEVMKLCRETGFEVVDAKEGGSVKAELVLRGEGFSETAGQLGNLVSVKARVEIKAVERKTGRVLAADRQTAVVLDVTEQVGAKTALQEAAAQLAERLLPAIVAQAEGR